MDFLRENKALRFILALAVFALCLWLVVSGQQLTGTPGGFCACWPVWPVFWGCCFCTTNPSRVSIQPYID